jgi:hypothetical protein
VDKTEEIRSLEKSRHSLELTSEMEGVDSNNLTHNGRAARSCEYCNEHLVCIKCGEFIEWLRWSNLAS